ncbi:MAG: SUMF1/EgtB/PvdO family nonheme iron enzyme, partial [Chloroflexi bacterium]|nr:SUMF1/EgtB/PvdO family nonheme iron enzyme [Chloroflexota bacterium]
KVLRGGSWNNNENNARASNRNNNNPNNQNDNIGFRCVAAAPGVVSASQVHRVHGRGASAPGEHSRPGPGWAAVANSTKDTLPPSRPVGLCRGPGRWQLESLRALKGR